jgi:Protein of unknown function (DUF1553)/Protein of unknown function (DUF1549)/Planctomycete cytochrome C
MISTRKVHCLFLPRWLPFGWLFLLPSLAQAVDPTTEQIEFFEKEIRPVLVEKCYNCHSAQSPKTMGGLRLDTAGGLLKGGDSGSVVVPGAPEKSLLIKAVSYQDLQLKMPPAGKLSDEEIQRLATWIRMGAPDPRKEVASVIQPASGIDFAKARAFWSFRQIQDPAVPAVQQAGWVRSPIDRFVLAQLESKGLNPAPPTDKHAWLRRVTFDLVGLPPAPQEIAAYVSDTSPAAQQRVVDRLLASPHYGERWARHWLDLVRFAETNGHEYDNDKLDAWRYRDYVIRAFNQDVAYDQFVKEHIAGDLLPQRRLSADGRHWESPLATGFYWFGEVLNSATDSAKSRADEVDNQIDVLTKAFLGLTGACSRCHDHKFDPIPTSDYYALAGFLHSTNVSEAVLDAPSTVNRIARARRQIAAVNHELVRLLRPALILQARSLKTCLLAAAEALNTKAEARQPAVQAIARKRQLSKDLVAAWVTRIETAKREPASVFYPFAAVLDELRQDSKELHADQVNLRSGPSFKAAWERVGREFRAAAAEAAQSRQSRGDVVFEDFETALFQGWTVAGQAFAEAPVHGLPPNLQIRDYLGQGLASSFAGGSDRMVGSLTSKKFKMPKLFVHVRMGGSREEAKGDKAKLRFTVVADGHKSLHLSPKGSEGLQWMTLRLTKEIGRSCYFEIVDRSREGHLVVDQIVLSDSPEPPKFSQAPPEGLAALLADPGVHSLESLANAYGELLAGVAKRTAGSAAELKQLEWALSPTGKLEDLVRFFPLEPTRNAASDFKKAEEGPERTHGPPRLQGVASRPRAADTRDSFVRLAGHPDAPIRSKLQPIERLIRQRRAAEESIPDSVFGMVGADEDPRDVRIHIRGNHKNLGEMAPRRFLQVVAGESQVPLGKGSGRLQLAEWMVRQENPLTARVMVNRIWKHHFGQGIVRSVDNFGETGERPTHPDLLDFLAQRFIESGWSIKAMHRMMVLTSTYAMSSDLEPEVEKLDPENKLLHRMPVQRLEAEAIRDAILAVAGSLDAKSLGPSVPPHISAHQDGRGKPQPGSLDGNGRRSIYIQVRRNFLTPLFMAFDYPLPISAIGRRSVSTVPSQALMLMNNEFVARQAEAWAQRLLQRETAPENLVREMFLAAFGRPASKPEVQETLQFAREQGRRHAILAEAVPEAQTRQRVWADVAHVLFNSAEFIYVQ